MCRLLGVVSSEVTDFRFSLQGAPRSLAALSPGHPDGWGVAVHDDELGWRITKHPACAAVDERFEQAATKRGRMLLAHVRKRTVGPVAPENTHPFRRDRWVFAHNGTIEDRGWLEAHTPPARLAQVEGGTDSERLFAYLLGAIDGCRFAEAIDEALALATRAVVAHGPCSANYLLANGDTMYAHRHGRELCLLQRGEGDGVRPSRRSWETGLLVETPWSQRRWAIFLASERLTDEPWVDVEERTLLRIEAGAIPYSEVVGTTGS